MSAKSVTERCRIDATDNKSYPLLDSHWVIQKNLPTFRIPNDRDISKGECSTWLTEMSVLVSFFSKLLTIPFDQFWAEMKHQKSLPLSINSFLEYCPKDPKFLKIPEIFVDVITQIYALVILILLRASKPAESEEMFLRAFEYEDIIHNAPVFDIPRLLDLSVLYGKDFPDYVTTIFNAVFNEGGKYVDDAIYVIHCAINILDQLGKNIAGWQLDGGHHLPPSNAETGDIVSNTIDYISEAMTTLGIFLSFLGPINQCVAEMCIHKNLVSKLINCYSSTIVIIRDHVLRSMAWSSEMKTALLNKLAIAAGALVKTIRVGFVEPGLVNKIMQIAFDNPESSSSQILTEDTNTLIDLMMNMLNHTEFATAYALLYSPDDDINLIREISHPKNVDKDQLDYLQDAFSHLITRQNNEEVTEAVPPSVGELIADTAEQPQPGCSRSSNFRAVKAVLPDTPDDVIERCLLHHNDSQAVITALLDKSVPLDVVDPNSLGCDIRTSATQYKEGQLWQGKREKVTDVQPLSMEERERVTRLAVSVWDDDDNGLSDSEGETELPSGSTKPQMDFIYDDEYDDTYDVEVGTKLEPVDEEEAQEVELENASNQPEKAQPFVSYGCNNVRGSRGKHRYRQVPSAEKPRQNVLPIENPEEIRARRQQTEASRYRGNGIIHSETSSWTEFRTSQYRGVPKFWRGAAESRGGSNSHTRGNPGTLGRGCFGRGGQARDRPTHSDQLRKRFDHLDHRYLASRKRNP